MSTYNKIDLTGHLCMTTTNQIAKIVAPLTNAFSIKHFRYLKLYNNGSRVLLSNHPDCIRFIYGQDHYKKMWFDGEYPDHLTEGWHIWDVMRAVRCNSEISLFEKEINKLLNLYHGMTLIKKDIGFYEIYTFDSDQPKIYDTNKRIFEHFIYYFKENANKIISNAEDDKIIIPLSKPLNEIELEINSQEISDVLNSMPINRYYLRGKYEGVYLTAKEAKCVYWLIQGKSFEEIAIIEGNKVRTVECHIDNIRRKLNCYKQTQIVRIILESGIFSSY